MNQSKEHNTKEGVEWEKEFEEIFEADWTGDGDAPNIENLKSFVRSLLLSQKKALLEKLEGEIRDSDECDCDSYEHSGCPHIARENALTRAKELIENFKG